MLLAIYGSLREVQEGPGERGPLVDRVFAQRVQESVFCGRCRKETHKNSYTQYFHNVIATSLRLQSQAAEGPASMASLLRAIEDLHTKSCDSDEGALALLLHSSSGLLSLSAVALHTGVHVVAHPFVNVMDK